MAGAPARMIAMNVAAWLIGLAAYATSAVPKWRIDGSLLLLGFSLVLLAATLAGTPVEGAARWVSVGPVTVQVSLIVLPAAIVLFARAPDLRGVVGIGLAALALALQPDRAMAGALAAGLAILALLRRDRLSLAGFGLAAAAFVATLGRPDRLPAVPFVDQVFYSSFDAHPLAGVAVLIGTGLLLVPAFLRFGEERTAAAAFGAAWLAIAAAAALGNYPTPVVGYGGSAILGYLLSMAVLRPSRRQARAGARAEMAPCRSDGDQSLKAAVTVPSG
jgi:cell division protein FtsW (lipid II flippase)